jgi:hypothetical protein
VAFLTESESAGIAERFRDFVGDDTINRLIVVSPYADGTLEGFSRLRQEFGTPVTSLIVDPNEHDFTAEAFEAQIGASLHSSQPHEWGGERRLHAKMIIACGARADYVFGGSANVSVPGLYSRFGGAGNAEAGIARTDPVGTAIGRLKLADCLSIAMPLSDLCLKRSARAGTDVEHTTPPDGGDCWIEHGFVFWRPPAGCAPADCLVRLTDSSDAEIAVAAPVADGDKWSLPLEPDAGSPRSAVMIFPDLSESAPVPIAVLNRLQTNANPPRSGAAGRILAELECRDDIDIDDYERAIKLLALARPDEMRNRDTKRKHGKNEANDDGDEGEILSEVEFGEIAESVGGRQNLKAGPVSEMRRLINAFIGLGTMEMEDDDALDPLTDHISNSNNANRTGPDGGGGNDDNGGGEGENTEALMPKRPHLTKASMTIASARADKLVSRVEETCRALARPDLDPLNLESAIRIHLLINVFLRHCAPVGEKASPKHPILAVELPRSWIRILGRLISALEASLKRSAQSASGEDLDEECVEALATILFCAGLLPEASRTTEMPRAVVARLEAVNASLARCTAKILVGRPVAEAAVREKLQSLAAKHHLSREKCTSNNKPTRSVA